LYLVHSRGDVGKSQSIYLFGLGSHPSDVQELTILYDALLELSKQDPEA
jgi:hypothetical protein